MVDRGEPPTRRTLVVAAVVAGVFSVALVALGWWFQDWEHSTDRQRFEDSGWWAGVASKFLGYLALGTLGFKLALAGVVGSISLATWARTSRRRPPS